MTKFLIHELMMGRGLKLKGCELLLFALIWSYTAKGKVMYVAEEKLAEMMMYSREQIGRSLRALKKKELIIREGKHPGRQSYDYVVNDDKVRQIIPSWCDDMSKSGETFNLKSVSGNVSSGRDIGSQDNNSDNGLDNKGEKNPLPFSDTELNERWVAMLKSPKWQGRTQESLNMAIAKLKEHPAPVAIQMITHTIEGDYPMIYDPTQEMIELAKRQAAKPEPKRTRPDTDIDDKLFGAVIRYVPQELRQEAFGTGQGGRALRFRGDGDSVRVICPVDLQNWAETAAREIESKIREIVPNAQVTYDYY